MHCLTRLPTFDMLLFRECLNQPLIPKAMRTFNRFLHVIAIICILTGCESCEEEEYHGPESDMLGFVELSINTGFSTTFMRSTLSKGSVAKPGGSVCHLEQFGSGTDAELGAFDVYLTCCWNPADGSHSCTEGFITDYEGNMLTIKCNDGDKDAIFTSDFPYDQTFIGYEFEFTGGKGRFTGASGRGIIDCEVKGESNLMIHHWEASLILLTDYASR